MTTITASDEQIRRHLLWSRDQVRRAQQQLDRERAILRAEALKARRAGWAPSEIAQLLECGTATVRWWLRKERMA